MKLLKSINILNNEKIFFLGIKVGDIKFSSDSRRIRLIASLIRIKYDFLTMDREIRIFGLKLYSSLYYGHKPNLFLKIKFKKYYDRNIFGPSLLVFLEENNIIGFDDIYFLSCHSGEFFLLMYFFREILIKNNSKHPIIVTPYAYHKDIAAMFYPDISVIICPLSFFHGLHFLSCQPLNIGGKRLFVIFNHNYFFEYEQLIQNGCSEHFLDYLKKKQGIIKPPSTFPNVLKNVKDELSYKLKKLGLNSKFIIISPESKSNITIPMRFWDKLTEVFVSQGYDVFANVLDIRSLPLKAKTCFLKLDESRWLASRSQGIIGIRSGFIDITTSAAPRSFIMYTDFCVRGDFLSVSADKVLTNFTLTKIPQVQPSNNLYEQVVEYNFKETSLLHTICEHFSIKLDCNLIQDKICYE